MEVGECRKRWAAKGKQWRSRRDTLARWRVEVGARWTKAPDKWGRAVSVHRSGGSGVSWSGRVEMGQLAFGPMGEQEFNFAF